MPSATTNNDSSSSIKKLSSLWLRFRPTSVSPADRTCILRRPPRRRRHVRDGRRRLRTPQGEFYTACLRPNASRARRGGGGDFVQALRKLGARRERLLHGVRQREAALGASARR